MMQSTFSNDAAAFVVGQWGSSILIYRLLGALGLPMVVLFSEDERCIFGK